MPVGVDCEELVRRRRPLRRERKDDGGFGEHPPQHRRAKGGLPAFLRKPHGSLSFVLGRTGTLWADTMQGDPNNMNPRPANRGLRRALPLAVALVIGAAAGAGAYALSNRGSATPSASPLVVPAQPA